MTKQKLEFSWKYKDYELRACPKKLARFNANEPNETIDFVKWTTNSDGAEYCFSLAYWSKDSEGYDKLIDIDDPDDKEKVTAFIKNIMEKH